MDRNELDLKFNLGQLEDVTRPARILWFRIGGNIHSVVRGADDQRADNEFVYGGLVVQGEKIAKIVVE